METREKTVPLAIATVAVIVLIALFAWLASCPASAAEKPDVRLTAGTWFLGGGPTFHDDLGVSAVFAYQFDNGITIVAGPTYVPLDAANDPLRVSTRVTDWHRTRRTTINVTHPGKNRDEWGGQFLVLIPIGR